MNKTTKVGIATIGQSPRTDVVPEIKKLAGVDAEYLESGGQHMENVAQALERWQAKVGL